MEIQQLRKEFNQLLDKITQQSERFTGEAHLPSLEVSVMMSKINKLQEVTAVLKYATENMEDAANQKRRSYDAQLNEDRIEASNQIENVEVEIIEEVTLIKSNDQQIEKTEELEVEKENQVQEEQSEETTEQVGVETNSVGDKFLQTPISSLQDAFSLNDRYLFANELFNKDMSLFNGVIKSIDECGNLEAAKEILQAKTTELNWDLENEYFLLFQNKVERRFLS